VSEVEDQVALSAQLNLDDATVSPSSARFRDRIMGLFEHLLPDSE